MVVESESLDHAKVLAELRQLLGDSLVEISVETAEAPEAMQAECVDTHCDAPLRGGVGIQEVNNANIVLGYCSAGFLATNSFGQERLITAGHCTDGGNNNWRAAQPRTGAWHVIGRPAAERFSGTGDFATVVINNVPGWEPRGLALVHESNGVRPTARDERYPINGVGTSGQVGVGVNGGFLCFTGIVNVNPTRCGRLTAVGQSSTYNGVTVNNLGRVDVSVCSGMSGGPVYVGRIGYGIVASGTGGSFNTNYDTWIIPQRTANCRTRMYYQGLAQVLTDFDLTLMAP